MKNNLKSEPQTCRSHICIFFKKWRPFGFAPHGAYYDCTGPQPVDKITVY